jgi:cupin 2 domain-containing protein
VHVGNLFEDDATPATGERFDVLLQQRGLTIERIVSSAATTPTEYVQPQDEWVVLLRGDATLDVAGTPVELHAGDYVFLPSGTPHTVQRVSDGALWLAAHLE